MVDHVFQFVPQHQNDRNYPVQLFEHVRNQVLVNMNHIDDFVHEKLADHIVREHIKSVDVSMPTNSHYDHDVKDFDVWQLLLSFEVDR